eukprot:Skav230579  [mRNA]  locus=scaffold1455:16201:16857:+ [translate_table: standard]
MADKWTETPYRLFLQDIPAWCCHDDVRSYVWAESGVYVANIQMYGRRSLAARPAAWLGFKSYNVACFVLERMQGTHFWGAMPTCVWSRDSAVPRMSSSVVYTEPWQFADARFEEARDLMFSECLARLRRCFGMCTYTPERLGHEQKRNGASRQKRSRSETLSPLSATSRAWSSTRSPAPTILPDELDKTVSQERIGSGYTPTNVDLGEAPLKMLKGVW